MPQIQYWRGVWAYLLIPDLGTMQPCGAHLIDALDGSGARARIAFSFLRKESEKPVEIHCVVLRPAACILAWL